MTLTQGERNQLPVTQSNYGLILKGAGQLGMVGEHRFDGGIRVEGGDLGVGVVVTGMGAITRLQSDVVVEAPGRLLVYADIQGDVTNRGTTVLSETIGGDFHNAGQVQVSSATYGNGMRIGGDFSQSSVGVLAFALNPKGWDSPRALQVDGRADLAGTLQLETYNDDWGPYALPEAQRHQIIHATGGVFGQFDRWTSPGLFIEGSLQYGANDVWFNLVRIELAPTMTGIQASSLAIASGANIDSALAGSDGFAGWPPPALDLAQRQFLASASSLLWMHDSAQAARALESLSGHAHASVRDQLHAQVIDASWQLDVRLSELAYSPRPLAWSQALANTPGSRSFQGAAGGIDQWLSPRLLVGAAIGDGRSTLGFDRMGGQASGESPIASLYAHYRGEDWHATGQAGAGRATVWMQRPLDIGAADLHTAHSQRVLDHAFAHGEIGRDMALAGGRLVPFAALDYMALRSGAFAEQGDTGFELIGAAQAQAQLSGSVGARYARQWAFGRNDLRLDLGASYRHDLLEDGDRLRAAFRGVPDVWFDVPGQRAGGVTELRLGLGGALGPRWNWSMDAIRSLGNDAYDDYQLGFQRTF